MIMHSNYMSVFIFVCVCFLCVCEPVMTGAAEAGVPWLRQDLLHSFIYIRGAQRSEKV